MPLTLVRSDSNANLWQACVGRFLDDDGEIEEDVVLDGVGELANIVAGAAKNAIGDVSISVPQVVVGEKHRLHISNKAPTIAIPFDTDWGKFSIEFIIQSTA